MSGVPLLADLAGRRVVAVGGGPVVAAKLEGPLAAGADVVVVAPDLAPPLREAADGGRLRWQARTYVDGDLDGAWLALAGTASPAVNAAVVAEAERRRVWCVRLDAGGRDGEAPGSAAFLGGVTHGPLTIAVSTDGRAPALTAVLRAELAERYGPEYGVLAELMGELRADPQVRAHLAGLPSAERRARWRSVCHPTILDLIRAGSIPSARKAATACLFSPSV